MRYEVLSYRYAEDVLNNESFASAKEEVLTILEQTPIPLLDTDPNASKTTRVKRRKRPGIIGDNRDRYFFMPVNQRRLNIDLDTRFSEYSWASQPRVVNQIRDDGPSTGLKADFKKNKIQVEIQFGNMARWYTDVFKFQLSYSLEEIDVGILVVPKSNFAKLIDENVVSYERVCRELPWAKMSLTLPILVIGVEPDNYTDIETAYNEAARRFIEYEATKGNNITSIPFNSFISEPEPEIED